MLVKYNVGKLKVIFKRNDTCTCILYAAFLYDTGLISLQTFFFCLSFVRLNRCTQETHDQSLKCGEELQNQCLFKC